MLKIVKVARNEKYKNRFSCTSLPKMERFTSNLDQNDYRGPFYTSLNTYLTSGNVSLLADRTNGRAYATVLRLSVVSRRLSWCLLYGMNCG